METIFGTVNNINVNLLPAVNDEHGGVLVQVEAPMEPNVFHYMLQNSITEWKLQGKKGVWIKMPIELANLVEIAVKEGFWYHHAEPHYLMLVHWIADTESTIPANASHKVSIGAIVFNDKRELLVVQENCGRLKGSGIWKIPTGTVEEGESIYEGAIRELKEETGIDTEFVEVLAFRQIPKSFFNKSDLFFLCMMRPLSFDIQKQDLEIEAAQWMAFEEYANQPLIQKDGLSKYIKDLCIAKAEGDYQGFTPIPITSSVIDDHMSSLYFLKHALDQE
ncbi:nudix (nucleoside diphosphate linked moiety X)-type motif 6 [Datura stramonium]|uniref:Nudix (Nucleoside diphosphate linked moiety X)-type motif 6 n=1 Tax=Datura stramonium TaxID=4076 RepID=A0ABS8WGI5_DATST|nr:nudix (nucleoside diphosphate linked moiety X)-type motif 6 [Datura stramonium]